MLHNQITFHQKWNKLLKKYAPVCEDIQSSVATLVRYASFTYDSEHLKGRDLGRCSFVKNVSKECKKKTWSDMWISLAVYVDRF